MRSVLCLIASLICIQSFAQDGQTDLSSQLPTHTGDWSRDSFSQSPRHHVQKMIDELLPAEEQTLQRMPAKADTEPKKDDQ